MSAPEDYMSDEWTGTDSEINSDDLTDICTNDGSDDGSDGGSEEVPEIDPEVFGPLANITAESLIALASRIAKDVLHVSAENATLVNRLSGSFNIVHIVQLETLKLVIRVPATGWGAGMTKTAEDALASQVATMCFIRQQTGAPVPEVYSWDPTNDNEVGAPFICMSFLAGETASRVWFKDSINAEEREEVRLNILTSLANIMAKFSSMSFDKIGSIMQAEDGSIFLGPVLDWDEQDDGSVQVKAGRTYFSAVEYLACHMDTKEERTAWDRADNKLTKTLLTLWPDLDSHSRFVLCPPDFDSQNILVDDKGDVTGIIDWDLCQTMPPHQGYASYPGWITRDWDPLMYGWPAMDTEDSPDTLQRYRDHYNKELGKALSWKGDWALTEHSHITEAVWLAVLNRMNRRDILRKFVEVALDVDRKEALGIFYDIGDDYYDGEDWEELKENLGLLFGKPVIASQVA
ncbi:hypothetical protein FOCG_09000 [Fusarium oxysporum f. sp. radicis-lycopersici 26381]|uniref:Aminoglycoside phosphotransferase domain-containing protein n=1 Tax=Fusarium oxysporum Fo47 TaxID=660027 RepID=W9K4N3_FUSOX|nr:hypothetical protein FOZG_08407 [Fusarium oxysporum Fo47]EXL50815.1 hypothetical protein FOCG_09000 [Fusarium oxysporum f. sp. radicis-lycopersici 26381]